MVLISVLAGLALLAVIAASVGLDTRTGTTLVRNQTDAANARAAADAGVHWALGISLQNSGVDRFPTDWEFAGSQVRISVIDSSGLIDLNRASATILRNLFAAVGVEAERAGNLTQATLDYRDRDQNRRPNGAEDKDYRDAGMSHGAKDRQFETVDELGLVLGVDDALLASVRPALTVHGRRGRVNMAFAPPLVLRALSGQGIMAPDDGNVAKTAPRRAVRGRRTVHIRAQAQTSDGAIFIRTAIVTLTQTRRRPFTIIQWGQGRRLD